jgi:hypothetical protein
MCKKKEDEENDPNSTLMKRIFPGYTYEHEGNIFFCFTRKNNEQHIVSLDTQQKKEKEILFMFLHEKKLNKTFFSRHT